LIEVATPARTDRAMSADTLGVIVRMMSRDGIDAVRAVWNKTLHEPTPADALAIIEKSGLTDG
jgi:hypothetical protein